jgi:hypothetical protein
MPMDFPDMESLVAAAEIWKFRAPLEGETEATFRGALADFVRSKDLIESQEIRTGFGWDKWGEKEGRALVHGAIWEKLETPPPPNLTREEHLAWAKKRALAHLDRGDVESAVASMACDLKTHEDLRKSATVGALILLGCRTHGDVRRWIEGFR